MKITEEHIVDFIKQGRDKEVVPLFYKHVLPNVKKQILKNGGRQEDAQDAFQDAILLFYKEVMKGSFDPRYKVYGYLYKVSLYVWLKKVRRDQKIRFSDNLEHESDYFIEPKEELIESKNKDILREVFSEIGEKCIELLNITIFKDVLLEDVAIRMGFSTIGAVKMQHKRCKEKLITLIEAHPTWSKLAEKLC